MNNTGAGGADGTVAEVDLSINPATTNPVIAKLDLGIDVPSGVALTPTQLLVVAGDISGGHLYIFNQSDNKPVAGSPFAFPPGSDTFGISGVVYDPVHNQAVVSMCDAVTCTGSQDSATGWAIFDLATNKFGPVISAPEPDSVSLNPDTGVIVAPADSIDPPSDANAILAGNETQACLLSDLNLTNDAGDPDGSSADPTTNLFAVGDFFIPVVTVLNLNGATFSGPPASCMLHEAGTNPNSVDVEVFAATGDPSDVVAINPVTHQVLAASDLGPDVGLIDLPSAPSAQLKGPFTFAASSLPLQPDDNSFSAVDEPFSAAVDTCQNKGLIANATFTFLARVDLATLHDHPAKISTALPKGTCFGGFSLSCDNGNGVTFFPLPVEPSGGGPISVNRRLRLGMNGRVLGGQH
ncbi:MAG TPA: hypothetical protein VKB84_11840 [Candidatus Binataceae bacterium]|nr:hypothetical protein [Candidatus Binataceae bacterium]